MACYKVDKIARTIHDRYELFSVFNKILMAEGLNDWTIKEDRTVRRLGQCRYMVKEIGLSKDYIRVMLERSNPLDLIVTFLHEVAHIKAGHGAGHGPIWREWCTALGIDGEPARKKSTPETSVIASVARFRLVHRDTGEVFKNYLHKPRRTDFSRTYIIGRKEETLGKLIVEAV